MSTADNIVSYYKQYCDGYNKAREMSYNNYRANLQPGERCKSDTTWRLTGDERAAFSQAYGSLRNKAQAELDKLRSRRRKDRAKVPPVEVMTALESLKSIPVSEEVLNGFAEAYGEKYYLVRSTLQKLASDNSVYGVDYLTDEDVNFEQDFEQLAQLIDRAFTFGNVEARAVGGSDAYHPAVAWQLQELTAALEM